MPDAVEKPVWVDGKVAKGFKALVASDGHVYDIVSWRYEVIKHKEVVDAVRTKLQEEGYEFEENVQFGKRGAIMFYRILLPEMALNDDNSQIKFGFLVTNSYDRSMGINVNGYAFRMACLNQMVFGKEVMAEFAMHARSTKERDLARVKMMVERVIERLEDVRNVIQEAQKGVVNVVDLANFIEKLRLSKKMKENLVRVINKYVGFDISQKLKAIEAENVLLNRWKVYNAFTDAFTHYRMNEVLRYDLLKRCCKLLI